MIGRMNQPIHALASVSVHSFEYGDNFDKQISKFWEIEEDNFRNNNNYSLEEKRSEEHYLQTVSH